MMFMNINVSFNSYFEITRLDRESFVRPGYCFKKIIKTYFKKIYKDNFSFYSRKRMILSALNNFRMAYVQKIMRGGGDSAILLSSLKKKEVKVF